MVLRRFFFKLNISSFFLNPYFSTLPCPFLVSRIFSPSPTICNHTNLPPYLFCLHRSLSWGVVGLDVFQLPPRSPQFPLRCHVRPGGGVVFFTWSPLCTSSSVDPLSLYALVGMVGVDRWGPLHPPDSVVALCPRWEGCCCNQVPLAHP